MSTAAVELVYPESDGLPMADDTLQWDWMVKIVGELREQYAGQEVFVAGNLFWYPMEGDPATVAAPDALVCFGRPPGHRRSYQQWREGGVAPRVVFEVLSHSNTDDEMADKLDFYDRHGPAEYYVIDPYTHTYEAFVRRRGRLVPVPPSRLNGYVSPALGIRFVVGDGELTLLTPDGRPFQSREDREAELADELRRRADEAESERQRAESERQRRLATEAARDRLAAKLRELGIDPDAV